MSLLKVFSKNRNCWRDANKAGVTQTWSKQPFEPLEILETFEPLELFPTFYTYG